MKKTKLNKGDLASLQSLSGGMAGDKRFFHKFKIGQSRIEEIGLKTVVSDNALKGIEYLSKNPEKRAKDLVDAFLNPEVKIIIANIGGLDSHKLIPSIDKEILINNPKPILGYSDITSLHLFLYTLGIQTYYGPSVLDGFAENVEMHKITKDSVMKVLFTNEPQIIKQSKSWTSEFLDWSYEKNNLVKRKMNQEQHDQIWINFDKELKGNLIGGCLDTLVRIKNESFFPKLDVWNNSIIFLETSEQKITPEVFKDSLKILEKEINACQAIIFGKPKDEKYFKEYLEIIKADINKPIIFNLNFGHTAPLYTIPCGGQVEINPIIKEIKISK